MRHQAVEVSAALQGRYTIEQELGRGGMATVYLAVDQKLHRRVAVKILHPELGATLGPERFQREIAIAARLTHPHILPLYDSGAAEGRLFYTMPYVVGESLRERLRREAQLPIAEAVGILTAVAGALDYAHRQGVVHRDIKPENILLAHDPAGGPARPLVADFGIARALDASGSERLTETGLSLGTPSYMSPEQGSAGGRVDGRSDIYALGCVGYEMLAGAPPFTGPTTQAILARHALDPVPPLATVRSTVPQAVAAAIERALAKVPADRFATAAEFAVALGAADAAPQPDRWRQGRGLAHRSRRRVALALGLAALGAGAAGALVAVRAGRTPRVIPSAASIAVLPFIAAAGDTALTRLGRDLAVTISASLDGVGGLETADRLSVANATADRADFSAADAAILGRRLGASSVLRGTLVGTGDRVRLDIGLYATEGLAPLARGITVGNHRDSLGALTDSVTWALLRQIWQRGEPPSPSLDVVATRSLPALRAFLDGERALAADRWGEAVLAYRSAIAADTGFWLANFRYAFTKYWLAEGDPEPEVLARLQHLPDDLAERERLLLGAFLVTDRTPRLRLERLAVVTRRFPEYWPGWFMYADALFHFGPITGHLRSETIEAFRRVVALNPKLMPAWEHLFHATVGIDQSEASRAYTRLTELGWNPPARPGLKRFFRLELGISGGGGVLSPELGALADSVNDFMLSPQAPEGLPLSAPLGLVEQGFPAAQLELNRRALSSGRAPPAVSTALRAANAWSWAARGQWDSAFAVMDRVVASDRDVPALPLLANLNYRLAVTGALLGAVPPAFADQRPPDTAAAVALADNPMARQHTRAEYAWLAGLLAFAHGDRLAIGTARRAARASEWYQADLVDRSLAAFAHALAGDRKRAGRELAALEEYCLAHDDCDSWTPYMPMQRFFAAQWLQEAGDFEQAARLLRWSDAGGVGVAGGWGDVMSTALIGPTLLARGRLEEAHGSPGLAREYYQQFLRRYDRPVPAQQHLVDEAQAAVARLSGLEGGR